VYIINNNIVLDVLIASSPILFIVYLLLCVILTDTFLLQISFHSVFFFISVGGCM